MSTLSRITINPAICLGQPAIRNTRITVSLILKLLLAGKSAEEILRAYPELELDDIHEAEIFLGQNLIM